VARELKTVLITGAGGFGRVLAREAREQGYHVVMTTRNDLTRAQAMAADPDLRREDVITVDFTDPKALQPEFWQKVIADHHIDGIINSAMISPKAKPRADKVPEDTAIANTLVPEAIFAAAEKEDVAVVQQSALHADKLNSETDAYRLSKHSARQSLQNFVEDGTLKGAVVELGMMTEPDNGHFLIELLAALPVEMRFQTDGQVQPIDVRDAAQGMLGILDNLSQERWDVVENGKCYQGAGPKAMPWPEYFQEIREGLGIGERRHLSIPLPLNKLTGVLMELNSQLPFQVMGNVDGYDAQELRRDFRVSDAERDAFCKAGNLSQLRGPAEIYAEWAQAGNHAPEGLAALLHYMGVQPRESVWKREAAPVNPADFPVADKGTTLVVGATGFVGPALVEELARSGQKVVCGVRDIEKARKQLPFPNVEFIEVDLDKDTDASVWRERLEQHGITAIVNNAGVASTPFGEQSIDRVNHLAPRALFEAAESLNHVRGVAMDDGIRAIQVSSTGVYWDDCQQHDYPRTKLALDNDLQQMHDLNYVIVRPNIVLEPGRGHLQVEKLVSFPVIPHTGEGEIQPINNRELAIGIARLVGNPQSAQQQVLDACGPERMRWKDLFHDVRKAVNRKPTLAPAVPTPFAQKVMAAMHTVIPDRFHQRLGTLAKLDKDTIVMVSRGSTRDPAAWQKATGVTPSSLVDAYVAYLDSPQTHQAYVDNLRDETPAERKSRSGSFVSRYAYGSKDSADRQPQGR
jgi:nucleoside-diphosphate-sugar epimerase